MSDFGFGSDFDIARVSHILLDGIIGVIPDICVCLDRLGRIVLANSPARSLFGDSVIGTPLSGMIRVPSFLSSFDRLVSGLSISECVSWEYGVPAERYFDIYLSSFAYGVDFSSKISDFPCFLVLFRETTSSFRVAHMRSDFVANASHELRTPLAGIMGAIEVLQGEGGADAAHRREFLSLMSDQAGHMSVLIDNLLSLNQLESDRGVENFTRLDILAVIRRVCESVGVPDGTVVVSFPDGVYYVSGDGHELSRCFRNLIENGLVHGGGHVVIGCEAVRDTDGGVSHIRIDVSDRGLGIARAYLPRLTERFYRVPGVSGRGSGLGLSIVKHIVGRHGGSLSIASDLGKGSVFSVTLPVVD